MTDAAERTFEGYKRELEQSWDSDEEKIRILHRAEQEGDLTLDEYYELCSIAFPYGYPDMQ